MLVGDLLMKALLPAPLQLLPSLHARVTTKKSGTEDLDIKDMIKQVVMGVVVGHKEGEKEVSKHFIDLLRMPLQASWLLFVMSVFRPKQDHVSGLKCPSIQVS